MGLMRHFPPEAVLALALAGFACAFIVRHGYVIGFRRRELRNGNEVIATGTIARNYGVFIMGLGVFFALCIVTAIALIAVAEARGE